MRYILIFRIFYLDKDLGIQVLYSKTKNEMKDNFKKFKLDFEKYTQFRIEFFGEIKKRLIF
jgi:hypothetical protein